MKYAKLISYCTVWIKMQKMFCIQLIYEGDRKKYGKVLGNFNQFSQVWKTVIIKRAAFKSQHQQQGETSKQYNTGLYCLVETCLVKTLLQDLQEKVHFSCIPARSCKIWSAFAGILQEPCARFLLDSYKISQDVAGSCRNARKKTFSWKILQEHFYWVIWRKIWLKMRDHPMVGIKDKSLSERLQMDAVLMLDKAKRAIRQHEAIQHNRSL